MSITALSNPEECFTVRFATTPRNPLCSLPGITWSILTGNIISPRVLDESNLSRSVRTRLSEQRMLSLYGSLFASILGLGSIVKPARVLDGNHVAQPRFGLAISGRQELFPEFCHGYL
jgi:hypothetical protein